jgi:hypothetical protein
MDLVENFFSREKEITNMAIGDFENYRGSALFKRLINIYLTMKACNDLDFPGPNGKRNNFKSNIQIPLVKPRAILRNAILSQNFRGDPLITILKAGTTSLEQARNIQLWMNHNLRLTLFRERTFRQIKKSAAEYGTAVCYSMYYESTKKVMRTQMTPFGIDRVREVDENRVVLNYLINILDYFQDPEVAAHWASDYQGHIERIDLATLMARIKENPDVYIDKNVRKVIEKARKEDILINREYEIIEKEKPENHHKIDIIHIYHTLPIKDNEENQTKYYMEIVDDKIIRFQSELHDNDLVPYSIFTYYPREDAWYGNADSQFVLPHENFTHLIMNAKADNALRALQQYIFYGRGQIDPADWNNRRVNGGLIGVDLKDGMDIARLLYPYQFPDNSLQTTDSIMREIKESEQKLTPRPDFTRPGSKSGLLQNTTATAANILEEQGDVVEADLLEGFAYGLMEMARNDITIFQQHGPEAFEISPDPMKPTVKLHKAQILGDIGCRIETALTKNKTSELQRMENFFTWLQNARGTQDPALMRVNLEPIVKQILQKADVGEMEEIYPEQPPMQVNPMQQGQMPPQPAPAAAAL